MSDDTISRAAAIDEIARWIGYLDEDMIYRIQTGLKKLPSADPEAEIVKVLKMVEEYKEKTGTDEIIIMPKNGMKAWDENGVEYTMQPTCNKLETDCISRQGVIDVLSQYPFEKVVNCISIIEEFPSAQPQDIARDIANIIENEKDMRVIAKNAQPEPHWIPCSERLPEESGRYLISVLDGVGRRTTVAPYQPRYKAWTMTGRMAYWKVIAWLPLPEPYKAESEDK